MTDLDFEDLQKEIEEDLNLSPDNLNDKLYKIPNFHSKILRHYFKESLELEKMEAKLARLYAKKFRYYTNEYDFLVKPAQANFFIFGDDEYSKRKYQVNKQKLQVDYLEKSVKRAGALSFDVKNIIEYVQFMNGS